MTQTITTWTEDAPCSLAERAHRALRERRFRMFEARLKKDPIKVEIETVVSEPTAPHENPVEVVTKSIVALGRFDLHNGNPSISFLLRCCAQEYGVSKQDLISKWRLSADITRPRQIAMYLAKKMTLLSFPKIGWHIGHRDHSTVLYAVSKIKMLIASDAELAARVALIQTKIEEAVAEATRAVPVQTARPMSPRGEHHGG